MSAYKNLPAILSIALIAGFGTFSISNAINAQAQRDEPNQEGKRHEKRERSERKGDEDESKKDNDSEEADVDEPEEENEADEQSEQAELAGQAIISREQAQAVALQNVSGEVTQSELEDEDATVVWGVEIRRQDGTVADVNVDAKKGKFVKAEMNSDRESGEADEDGETENG